jgi:hypothetical protein
MFLTQHQGDDSQPSEFDDQGYPESIRSVQKRPKATPRLVTGDDYSLILAECSPVFTTTTDDQVPTIAVRSKRERSYHPLLSCTEHRQIQIGRYPYGCLNASSKALTTTSMPRIRYWHIFIAKTSSSRLYVRATICSYHGVWTKVLLYATSLLFNW